MKFLPIEIICRNNMLKKVSFVFIFTLESTASSSCWAVVSAEYLFSTKSFECCPPKLLLGASEGVFRKSFCIFLPFSANISIACFFYLAEATRCSLNFFPNKFLSWHCNKSVSSFNFSLDCCAGQLRGVKML